MIRRVIITGATGSIGMALIKKCIEEGIEPVVLVNPNSNRLKRVSLNPKVSVVKCGLNDYADSDPASLGLKAYNDGSFIDAFFHLAWSDPIGPFRNDESVQNRNVVNALEAVKLAHRLGSKVFVGTGSQAECGLIDKVIKADTPCNPINAYGKAKLRASIETRELCKKLGMNHIWTRILSVYGPYDGGVSVFMSLIKSLLDGEKMPLTAGEQMWDYLYSDDAASALLLLAQKGKDGSVYPIGSGSVRPLHEYFEQIRNAIDPLLPLGLGELPYPDGQIMYLRADISNLSNDTGFKPTINFEEGVKRTVSWVKENNNVVENQSCSKE